MGEIRLIFWIFVPSDTRILEWLTIVLFPSSFLAPASRPFLDQFFWDCVHTIAGLGARDRHFLHGCRCRGGCVVARRKEPVFARFGRPSSFFPWHCRQSYFYPCPRTFSRDTSSDYHLGILHIPRFLPPTPLLAYECHNHHHPHRIVLSLEDPNSSLTTCLPQPFDNTINTWYCCLHVVFYGW